MQTDPLSLGELEQSRRFERSPANDVRTQTEAPVFIFGARRSGTSLLSRMLDGHPRIAVPYESHLFRRFSKIVRYYGDLSEKSNRARLVDDALALPMVQQFVPRPHRQRVLQRFRRFDLGGLCAAILDTWAEQQGKPRWGEKTPKHAFHWQEINAAFPDAFVLHIVRDGRDVARSTMQARHGPKSIYASAREWAAYLERMERIEDGLPPGRFLTIFYEDLLEDPRATLSRVCQFLGETYCDDMLTYYRKGTPYPTDDVNKRNLRKPVLTANAGRWRMELSRADKRVVEAVAGNWLERFGYPLTIFPTARLSATERFYRRFIEHPPRRLYARLKDRQGQAERLSQMALLLRLLLVDQVRESVAAWRR